MKNTIYRIHKESVIFEETQNKQIDHHGKDQTAFYRFFIITATGNVQPQNVIEHNGKNHEHNIDRFAPGVEKNAHEKKHRILKLLRYHIV